MGKKGVVRVCAGSRHFLQHQIKHLKYLNFLLFYLQLFKGQVQL